MIRIDASCKLLLYRNLIDLTHHHYPYSTPHYQHDQGARPLPYDTLDGLMLLQIWSMKKNEDAAAKKKPKTSAAQIRVQKGAYLFTAFSMFPLLTTRMAYAFRLDRVGPPVNNEDTLPRSRRSPQLHSDDHT